MKKTTPNFKTSENVQNNIIPCTEHQAKVIYMIKNSPLMFGAWIVAITLRQLIDGVISIFDCTKGWVEIALFMDYFFNIERIPKERFVVHEQENIKSSKRKRYHHRFSLWWIVSSERNNGPTTPFFTFFSSCTTVDGGGILKDKIMKIHTGAT